MEIQAQETHLVPGYTRSLSQSTLNTNAPEHSTIPVSSEEPNTKASALWTCTICDVTVSREYRQAHESGMWHISKSKVPLWTCLICNITIGAPHQADHEKGYTHCKNRDRFSSGCPSKGSQEWTCTVCKITVDEDSRVSHCRGQVHQMAVLNLWVCPVCSITIPQKSQVAHEKKHQPENTKRKKGKASRSATGLRSAPTPVKTWTCIPCGVTVNTASKDTHEVTTSHRKASGGSYPCEVCGVVITSRFRESHEAARIHMAAVVSREATTASHKPQVGHRDPFDLAAALKVQSDFEAEKLRRAQQQPLWTCTICDITIDTEDRKTHENDRVHRKMVKEAAKTWTCVTCEVKMRPEVRMAHEKSGQHTARVLKMERAAHE